MVQLATERTVFFLYAVLVVLPAAVFGGLLWHQLDTDHDRRLAEIPSEALDATRRVQAGLEAELALLIEHEEARPFYHYKQDIYEGRATTNVIAYERSPLESSLRPEGVLGWFSFDAKLGTDALVELFYGYDDITKDHLRVKERHERLIREHAVNEPYIEASIGEAEFVRETGDFEITQQPFQIVAVNVHKGRDPGCVVADLVAAERAYERAYEAQAQDSDAPQAWRIPVYKTRFQFHVVRDDRQEVLPMILARRRIYIKRLDPDLALPVCFEALEHSTSLVQGFLLDPNWLFHEIPSQIADQALSGTQQLLLLDYPETQIGPEHEITRAQIFEHLDWNFEFPEDRELGILKVVVDKGEIARNFRVQTSWFVGVAGVMVVSLVIGIRLLLGSVRASREQARRTENFVAAVTHELRTPIAAVKLYGEMLQEGWASDEAKRKEYLAHILSASDRLDTLVDRVLEKRKLSGQPVEPVAGDLNAEVRKQIAELSLDGAQGADIEYDLAPDLPPVLLTPDGVHAVLCNLVENARKYAPVDPSAGDVEPLRVVTRLDRRSRVVLEVLDRGPGIPEQERSRVFDAFYRVGDEATRHQVQALARPGGGTAFRITFKTLKGATPA